MLPASWAHRRAITCGPLHRLAMSQNRGSLRALLSRVLCGLQEPFLWMDSFKMAQDFSLLTV